MLFAITTCAFLWRPVFRGDALLPGDYLAQMSPWNSVLEAPDPAPQWNPLQWDAIAQFYPWRVLYARSMLSGHIPLWNPHQFCGTPFLANGQSAVLYPLNLVFLIFDPITAFTVFAVLHLFLAASFTYLLLRELGVKEFGGIVGGITFAFSAFMVLWLELPTFISAAVWLPITLLLIHRAVERRSFFHGMLSGLTIALAFLAGHFQIAFYVAFAAMLWWLWKLVSVWRSEGKIYTVLKVVVPLCGCIATAVLISAPQVLPTQELAANSHRVREATPQGYARFIGNAVQPYRLVTAFVPDFFGNPSKNNYYLLGPIGNHIGSAADYMEYGLYTGILPLMLVMFSVGLIRKQRHVGFFAVLSLLAMLTAIGTPLNYAFYYLIPGFSELGGPNRILLLYFFGVAVLAGFGGDYIAEHGADKVRSWRGKQVGAAEMPMLWAALVIIALFEVCRGIAVSFFGSYAGLSRAALDRVDVAFVALLVASVVPIVARAKSRVSRDVFSILAIAVVIADLFAFGINYNPTCDRSKVYPETPLTNKLQSIANDSRIAPINPSWSLFTTPDAMLPPNAAMVYGLYDVQGYDSLFLRSYQRELALVEGTDPSPPENGNMVLVRPNTPLLWKAAGTILTNIPLPQLPPGVEPLGTCAGVYLYRASEPEGFADVLAKAHVLDPELASFWPVGVYPEPGNPNKMSAEFLRGPTYPGWKMIHDRGEKLDRFGEVGLAALPGQETARFVFEPFSFRLGLFLMFVGVSALACVGIYRQLKNRSTMSQ